jgi:hypothetical protein
MSIAKYAFCALLLIGFAGCTKKGQENAAQQPPAETQQAASPSQAQPAVPEIIPAPETAKPVTTQQPAHAGAGTTKKAVKSEPKPPVVAPPAENAPVAATKPAEIAEPPKPPEPKFATLAEGTKVQVRLQEALDSAVNKTGDTFSAILDKDIVVDGAVVAPRGSVFGGKLTNVTRSGKVEGLASMSLQLTSLTVRNQTYPLQTENLSFEAESTKKKDATKVGIGAGIGAVIGAIAGGGKGAAIGAAVGGGAGGAAVIATRGKEVKLDAEQAFSFVLRNSISVKLQ